MEHSLLFCTARKPTCNIHLLLLYSLIRMFPSIPYYQGVKFNYTKTNMLWSHKTYVVGDHFNCCSCNKVYKKIYSLLPSRYQKRSYFTQDFVSKISVQLHNLIDCQQTHTSSVSVMLCDGDCEGDVVNKCLC